MHRPTHSDHQHAPPPTEPTPADPAPAPASPLARLRRQLARRSPFHGTIQPRRVPLFAPFSGRPSLPFPHPFNFRHPLRILDTFFHNADLETDRGPRHTRYLDAPGFAPVLVTRDPDLIRAISVSTGDLPGQFDRDTMPTSGIARATGEQTLLYANGAVWRRQKQLVAPAMARSTLFNPETFSDFEATFRTIAAARLEAVRQRAATAPNHTLRVHLEPEIKAAMLEMLVNSFFGADVPSADLRSRDVPALDLVIDNIVKDTIMAKAGCPMHRLPSLFPGVRKARAASAAFESLVSTVIAPRSRSAGLWKQFHSDAPDDALRPNVRVFLAGALEATTSYASWALAHLARDPAAQQRLYNEVKDADDYTPETLKRLEFLACVLNETLRLTPALYFHPRRATADTPVRTEEGQTLLIPGGTHILLDVWHANRHDDFWGTAKAGAPADCFAPERWWGKGASDQGTRELLHFGFGHGPRFCPGKNLGQLETALVVGAVIKLFELRAVTPANPAKAGVSTKPSDGVLVDLRLRTP